MQKNALVLAGGGSRGSYQIGVWQALSELDIKIDTVTGTSVGALNAALVAMGSFETAQRLWQDIETSMVFAVDLDESLPMSQKINTMVKQFISDYAKQGGTDAYPLKQVLDKTIDYNMVVNSGINCGIVAFDKKKLKPLEIFADEIEPELFTEYLLASSSLYPAIKSCKIGDNEYVDGGYGDNLPIELAMKRGADFVIAVDLEAVGIVRKDTLKLPKNLKVIKSYWDLGPLLVFDGEMIRRNMRLGYLDTMKAFGAFEGKAYTFIKNQIRVFMKEKQGDSINQNRCLGISFQQNGLTRMQHMFMLHLNNHLKRKYGKGFKLRQSSFFLACIEAAAECFEISPEKIYSINHLNERLLEEINKLDCGEKPISATRLEKNLALLSPKSRVMYIGALMKKAVIENKRFDISALSFLMPNDALAAYYLALIL